MVYCCLLECHFGPPFRATTPIPRTEVGLAITFLIHSS